jgi:hypothetical protein
MRRVQKGRHKTPTQMAAISLETAFSAACLAHEGIFLTAHKSI